MQNTADVIVVGGGPVAPAARSSSPGPALAPCCSSERPRSARRSSGAHANCGLLVPSDATPLAAPGVLGQGLNWMLDSSSPFYIAPRPEPGAGALALAVPGRLLA